MQNIAKLLFEARILKEIPRSGLHFLGAGQESVAEHSFVTAVIAYAMSKITTDVDALRLISMCILHDLPEARIGDLNYVHKNYVVADENQAVRDTTKDLPFGSSLADLIHEFNEGKSMEAKLARDADQLAFILELKALIDIGYEPPRNWLPLVVKRLETPTGKELAASITETAWDAWWLDNYVDRSNGN